MINTLAKKMTNLIVAILIIYVLTKGLFLVLDFLVCIADVTFKALGWFILVLFCVIIIALA